MPNTLRESVGVGPYFSEEDLLGIRRELEGYLEKAEYQGNKKDVEGIRSDINEIDRQIKDIKAGGVSEAANFGRNAVNMATLGFVDDETFAKVSSIGGIFESYDEAAARIQGQRELGKDNSFVNQAGSLLGAFSAAATNARLAGVGKTYLGTAARQGGVAIAETMPYSYRDIEASKKFAEEKAVIDGSWDTDLAFADYVNSFNMLVLAGAVGGGLGALTMGKARDWGSTPSSKPFVATEDGARTQLDDIADQELDAVSRAAAEAQPMINEAFEKARASREKMRSKLDYGPVQPRTLGVINRPGQHQFSMLDEKPWVNRKTPEELQDQSKSWRDASTAGEVADAVSRGFKNFMKDKIMGLDNRLQWDVSREVGGRFQVANERTVRELTQEIEEFVRPADRVFRLNIEDPHLQALLLDFANDGVGVRSPIKMADVKNYITERLSAKDADAFERYYLWSKKNSVDTMNAFTGRVSDDFLTNQYLHTRLTNAAKERKGIEIRDMDELELNVDPGTLKRDRNFYFKPTNKLRGGQPTPSDYLPVLQTDLRRIMNNRLAINLSDQMGMPRLTSKISPEQWLKQMENTLISRGIHGEGAAYATKHIKDHMIGVTRSPELWLQALNSFGYMKTLAGPKSAILNLHDPAMAVVNFDVPFTEMIPTLKRAYMNKAGADVRASGIDQKVGEFVNDHINSVTRMESNKQFGQRWWADNTREMTDKFMKWSLFERTDFMSKNSTLNVILEQMVREAKDGTFAQKWGFYLNPTDMGKVVASLKRNGADFKAYKNADEFKLVEDVVFAGLGQQQLISASGRSSAWARNPNLRPMWALRGFASKQQGILMWKVVENFRKGNTKEAYKYLGMYATVVGGSFGVLNESRQWLFGDGNFDLTGIFMGMADQMLSTASVNTLGLNDYQWGRINEVGIAQSFIESLVPIAVDAPFETGRDIVATLQNEQGPLFPVAQFPLVKQPIAFSQNMIENVGQTVDNLTFDQVDVRPYIKDPQEEVLKRVGLLKDRGEN